MGYFYAIMWLVVGLILIFSMSRENKIFYLAGGFFILLAAWWFFNTLYPESGMFTGAWGTALRVVTLIALIGVTVVFYREYSKNSKR